jgi:hypothetical protein
MHRRFDHERPSAPRLGMYHLYYDRNCFGILSMAEVTNGRVCILPSARPAINLPLGPSIDIRIVCQVDSGKVGDPSPAQVGEVGDTVMS